MKRLTYDFEIGGNHCWQVKGADNLECREVCERQGDNGCKTCPISKAFDRLAAYEDTGLEPEEIKRIYQEWSHYLNFAGERNAIDGAIEDIYDNGNIDYNRLRELAQADREGRCVVLPEGGCEDKDGENALKSAMNTCFYHNNPVTRFIADAVAEKLTHQEAQAALRREQE